MSATFLKKATPLPCFVKEKVTYDAGNAEGEIGSAQHKKGYSAAKRHSTKMEENPKRAAFHDKSE